MIVPELRPGSRADQHARHGRRARLRHRGVRPPSRRRASRCTRASPSSTRSSFRSKGSSTSTSSPRRSSAAAGGSPSPRWPTWNLSSFPEPFAALEAFNTSGGLSILPRLLEGKVAELDYKTIRYPGHCEKMRTLLDLGFASHEPIMVGNSVRTSRELFTELLRRKLDTGGPDVVLARSTVTGDEGRPAHPPCV